MKGFFVTGTDTDVGKTFVTCALARRARAAGQRVFAFKPIETGCIPADGRLVGEDQELLAHAAGDWQRGPLRGIYQLLQPAAPLVAAEAEGVSIDPETIAAVITKGSGQAELVLIEGAGGWRVPVTPSVDMGSLALLLGYPVIVVARAGLGTINHTLLTIEAVERSGGTVGAVVLSHRPMDDVSMTASNAGQIRRRWPGRLIVLAEDQAALDPLLG